MPDTYTKDELETELDSEKPSEDRYRAIRKRFEDASGAVKTLYDNARDDFRFAWVDGCQWDANLTQLRGDRPRYEFNRLRQLIKQVLNDNRQNTPTIKVRAVEDGDIELADIRQGLIRNIEQQSNADQAYDWGATYSITSGFGCWRVATEYSDDDTFDQNIVIKRIENPFSVYFDPAAKEYNRSDSRYAFVVQSIPKAVFKEKYPDAECPSNFDGGMDNHAYTGWYNNDEVRVAEYWQKHRDTKRIYRLSDGSVVDAKGFDKIAEIAANPPPESGQKPITIEATREVEYDRITYEIVSGDETLEGPWDWAGKYIPLIPCWGDIVSVDGADYWYGMVRHAKDAQTLFNYSQSNLVEVIAKQPNAPWLYTPTMIAGHEQAWSESAVNNSAGLPYNPDPTAPGGRPMREAPPAFPDAWFELSRINDDNLKAVTGIYDASLGQKSNETSGRAILARQHEGDVATYDYSDNIARAVQYTGIVVNDLIPHIYDAEREVRILGRDMTEKYVKVNHPVRVPVIDPMTGMPEIDMQTGEPKTKWVRQNDMTAGKYDIAVTTGPSFTTMRMEILDAMTQLAQTPGPAGALGAYGVMHFMDVPGMEEFADTYRRMLIQQGIPFTPKEGDQPPPGPPPPDPKLLAEAAAKMAKAARDRAEAEGQELANDITVLGLQVNGIPAPPGYQPGPNQPPQASTGGPPGAGGAMVPAPTAPAAPSP
ncbi:MAG TPA: portal protein [Gammaproteobacteria bacterium]|nr:portal protein [Gammaproteobacteria bacterium]